MASTLDISAAETSAYCDYACDNQSRRSCDFMRKDLRGCMLCPDESYHVCANPATSMSHHLRCTEHRTAVQKYHSAMRSIHTTESVCFSVDNAPVSRREVLVVHLGNRISAADSVHGTERFESAAVSYLMRRMTTGALLKAFQTVYGSERVLARGMCTVCMERPSTMMFSQCKHLCVCVTCAVRLRSGDENDTSAQCPVCRTTSQQVAVYIV